MTTNDGNTFGELLSGGYSRELTEIERSSLDFGLRDKKGREVGYGWVFFQAVFTPSDNGGWAKPKDMPNEHIMIAAFPTRDGNHYGASTGYLHAATMADAHLLVAKRIKQARKREEKRFIGDVPMLSKLLPRVG